MFGTVRPSQYQVKAALENAHEIRQFEIRLYWQRSLIYWGFVLTLFAGLGLIITSDEAGISTNASWLLASGFIATGNRANINIWLIAYAITLLGFFTCCAWRYLEKGSSAWQSNWELHIDFLEDHITGKLHKTILGDREDFFSVSKITKSVITAFTIFWFLANIMTIMYLFPEFKNDIKYLWKSLEMKYMIVILVVAVAALLLLLLDMLSIVIMIITLPIVGTVVLFVIHVSLVVAMKLFSIVVESPLTDIKPFVTIALPFAVILVTEYMAVARKRPNEKCLKNSSKCLCKLKDILESVNHFRSSWRTSIRTLPWTKMKEEENAVGSDTQLFKRHFPELKDKTPEPKDENECTCDCRDCCGRRC